MIALANTLLTSTQLHIHTHEHDIADGCFWHALPTLLGDVLASTLEITGLVILMMAIIEFVNVSSSGKLIEKLHNYPFVQLVIACLLGSLPGCAGGFAVVSMFTHNAISFGALAGGMIATFGDEAFFLFAKDPQWGLILTGILFALGLGVGTILNIVSKKWTLPLESHGFAIHDEAECHGHDHEHHHEEAHHHGHGFGARVVHFVKEHLWEHVIKQHLLTIFLWSFGVLLFLKIFGYFVDIEALMHTHEWAKYLLLLLAVLIGFIPESGPNLVFIIMFLEGNLPFGILLANSISQNGHAGLPLLAQSRKNFLILKTLTLLLGLIIGAIVLVLF